MAARLGGIKQKKSSWGSVMNKTFLLFYSSKPRSHVWILIYRKWSIDGSWWAQERTGAREGDTRASVLSCAYLILPGACYAGYKRVTRNPGLYESVFNHLNFPFTRFKKKVRVDLFEAYEYSGRISRWPLKFFIVFELYRKKNPTGLC